MLCTACVLIIPRTVESKNTLTVVEGKKLGQQNASWTRNAICAFMAFLLLSALLNCLLEICFGER